MSLSDSVSQLIDAFDDLAAKISAKINSKRASALTANNALKVQNKSAADITAEVEAIYTPHIETNPGNPHNLTLALVDAMSSASINALATSKLTSQANTVDFVGHPSIDGVPLANSLSVSAAPIKHCRFEKHPGDVLVLNMLTGVNNFGKQWRLNQIKCPRANMPEPLLPAAYHTDLPANTYIIGFGDGLRVTNINTAGLQAVVRRSTAVTNSELNNFTFTFLDPLEGVVSNYNKTPRDDGVFYSFGNVIGQFYYSDIFNDYRSKECVYPVIVDERDTNAELAPTSNSTSSLGSSSFGNLITDYCTFSGTTPSTNAFVLNGRIFTRDVLMEESETEIKFTIFTRVRFSFSTYKREFVQFFVREEFTRSKASSTNTFTKTYTSPKFEINYETDITEPSMVFEDVGGLAAYMQMDNASFSRTALYKGSKYIYGFNYLIEGVAVGGKFWKIPLDGSGGYDFENATETIFKPTFEALATLANACHLGIDAEGYANFYGRDIHGNAAMARTLKSGTATVTNPMPTGQAVTIDTISTGSSVQLTAPGAAYKLFGYNDGGITTAYSRNRFLYGVEDLQDTRGISSIANATVNGSGLYDTTFPYALQEQLAAAVLANMADYPNISGVVLDIIVPPQANITPFLIAYPYYSDDNPQLTGQNIANYHLYSFQTNVRVGNIASFSNLTRVYRAQRTFPQGVSPNNQLKEAWSNNTLCAPIIINQYETTKHRAHFDTLPVFAYSRAIGNKTGFCDNIIIKASFSATGIDVTTAGFSVTVVSASRHSWMSAPPTVQVKYTATNSLVRENVANPGILNNRFTTDTAVDPAGSLVYSGPWTEYLSVVSMNGLVPFRLGDKGGIVDCSLASVNQQMFNQIVAVGANANRNHYVYFVDNDGSATPDLGYRTIDDQVRSPNLMELSRGTATRTAITLSYSEPRVGISTYFVNSIPSHRSIMTKPNAGV